MTSTRGVIASAARLSPKRIVRRSSIAVSGGSAPARAEMAASRPSSSGERALASSSCGSTPRRRTSRLADSFSSRISQPNVRENARIGAAVASAAGIGRASARFFGTSSPKSIEMSVARASASRPEKRSAPPSGCSSGAKIRASAGSAR